MKVSLLLPSFRRAHLLDLGLYSILQNKPTCDFEILVLNDGIETGWVNAVKQEDATEEICRNYSDKLPIRYIFTGQRNSHSIVKRVPGFALNIGIKQATGDILILSCPEMFHVNKCIDIIANNVVQNPKSMSVPNIVYFDVKKIVTNALLSNKNSKIDFRQLIGGGIGHCHAEMPFLFGFYKNYALEIGGYDEDFLGYAAEDCDFIERLKLIGLKHSFTTASAIHLWHGNSTDGDYHWENPEWIYNYILYIQRMGIIKRNEGKIWGQIES